MEATVTATAVHTAEPDTDAQARVMIDRWRKV